MQTAQRSALREAGFTEIQTGALTVAFEPLATKEDMTILQDRLTALSNQVAVLHNDMRWMKWIGGAVGITVLAELVSRVFV